MGVAQRASLVCRIPPPFAAQGIVRYWLTNISFDPIPAGLETVASPFSLNFAIFVNHICSSVFKVD